MKLSLNTSNFTTFKMTAAMALLSLVAAEPVTMLAQQARSQTPQAAATPVAAPHGAAAVVEEGEEAEATPNKPGHEGIKVHGAWVVDVHNADGSLANHRAFNNSLAEDQGQNILFYLLSGQLTPSAMAIGAFQTLSIAGTPSLLSGYYLTPASGNTANLCSGSYVCVPGETTTVTPATRSAPGGIFGATSLIPGKIVLQGQVAPGQATTINYVRTILMGCYPVGYTGLSTLSPAACNAGPAVAGSGGATPTVNGQPSSYLVFTQTGIPDVAVAAGQYVVISVTITFS